MRVLWLDNSDDTNELVPEEERAPAVASRIIEERTGQTPELRVRPLWPSAAMPELAASWAEEFAPEMVCLRVGSYSYSYRSVPLRLERRLGFVGKPMARLGGSAASSRAVGERRIFHAFLELALRTVEGTHGSPPAMSSSAPRRPCANWSQTKTASSWSAVRWWHTRPNRTTGGHFTRK